MPVRNAHRVAWRQLLNPSATMADAFPAGNQDDGTATDSVPKKHRSHRPIPPVDDCVSHGGSVRNQKKAPSPERDRFRTAAIQGGPDNLRHVGYHTKAVAKRECS